jgi:hypothetical protein
MQAVGSKTQLLKILPVLISTIKLNGSREAIESYQVIIHSLKGPKHVFYTMDESLRRSYSLLSK